MSEKITTGDVIRNQSRLYFFFIPPWFSTKDGELLQVSELCRNRSTREAIKNSHRHTLQNPLKNRTFLERVLVELEEQPGLAATYPNSKRTWAGSLCGYT